MARQPSKISRMGPEVAKMVATLRIDHGWTIDEILARLQEIGKTDISRSSVGRHVKSLEEIGAQLRHSREVAQALVAQAGGMPESKQAQLNIELMHSLVLRFLTEDTDGKPLILDPENQMFMGRTLQSLAAAQKIDVDRISKLEAAAALKAKTTAADKAVKAARDRGMSKETVDAIRHAVLGDA